MPAMIERMFNRQPEEPEEYSPLVLAPDFDSESAKYAREMEDELIRLGHMKEDERMKIPPEIEFPEKAAEQQ
ncbi:hypothetical protein [Rhodococcus sp. ACS1]|uniref:hypothetical protein n=1 Tax=Rhodococcus sp. ACS1 TaxID=2028570 RepID=UPI00117A245E|nr:hypothetical protein [Rhodococcus sp. ACS1]